MNRYARGGVVIANQKRNFRLIARNIHRIPAGERVEIVSLQNIPYGSAGVFKGDAEYMLRSVSRFVIATSKDVADLLLLAVDKRWIIDGEYASAALDLVR